jgi:hypothetical protein
MINSLLRSEIPEQPIPLNRLLKNAKDSVQELAEAIVSRDSAS